MSVKENSNGDLVIRHVIPKAIKDEWLDAAAERLGHDENDGNKKSFVDEKIRASHKGVLKRYRQRHNEVEEGDIQIG